MTRTAGNGTSQAEHANALERATIAESWIPIPAPASASEMGCTATKAKTAPKNMASASLLRTPETQASRANAETLEISAVHTKGGSATESNVTPARFAAPPGIPARAVRSDMSAVTADGGSAPSATLRPPHHKTKIGTAMEVANRCTEGAQARPAMHAYHQKENTTVEPS